MTISPSILGIKDFSILDTFKEVNINNIHLDVMDGIFVFNVKYNHDEAKELKNKYPNFNYDVHFMTINPLEYIKNYSDISDSFTIHFEAVSDKELMDIIEYSKLNNIKLGLSIKPNTDVYKIVKYLKYLDKVLVMSVEPGKGGQEFIKSSLSKVSILKTLRSEFNYSFKIEVDGGINNTNIDLLYNHGADILVIGSYLTKCDDNKIVKERIIELKKYENR